MPTLRLTQHNLGQQRYRIELALEGERLRQVANVELEYALPQQDQERIRWYLETYLDHPHDPAPKIAARVEQRMTEIGADLFEKIFEANRDTRKLWDKMYDDLQETRVEIVTGVREAASIPWELLRDPHTQSFLTLGAGTFVRTYSDSTRTPNVPTELVAPIRILLVICRPGGREDVPFRSVAMRILKGLNEEGRKAFALTVLRPPTFERLGQVLRGAKADGEPFHVIHFDGHGAFLDLGGLFKSYQEDVDEELLKLLTGFDPTHFSPQALYPDTPRDGDHGYLCFENPEVEENLRLVDGSALGKLLVETNVPVLILNACRSAHAESPHPGPLPEGEGAISPAPAEDDPHSQVRAFGSLAQEVMDTGVAGVVAMRYNVYVVTAAEFVAELYVNLARGHTLGQAVTSGRKHLRANPLREVAYKQIPLQDWIVPVVYEAAPVPLFPKSKQTDLFEHISIDLGAAETTPTPGNTDPELPPEPDVGFYGRDEVLLTLERAFDSQQIVLLHAYAGSGKTTTAAEFARWYALTGGTGVALFTSFERHTTLTQALAKFERIFGAMLEQNGIHWLAMNEGQQRLIASQIMQQIPILWIWDNVETIAGFPAGTQSMWNEAGQQELIEFLRVARQTKAKILLTSRRDEQGWLGDLPRRIRIPAMPMRERVQLARGIADKHGVRLTNVDDWWPLLQFTQGNPLTITVLVGQALRDGLRSAEQIQNFVAQLRKGEAKFEDEAGEGRSKSLGASLQYGFGHAFSEAERKKLALLHFFQGFVDVDALRLMGDPEDEWCVPEVQGMTKEEWIVLLDRAAEVGLLTAFGGGYYRIHPALPWYFKSLFEEYYDSEPGHQYPGSKQKQAKARSQGASASLRSETDALAPGQATRAFVEAMGALGDYYHDQYIDGNRDVIGPLGLEENNLLHARYLARLSGWWHPVTSVMQGLRVLYDHTGRRSEWKQLVEEIVPDFVDPANDGPLPGREEHWSLVTEYRVRLAREARDRAGAEHLQSKSVEWDRQQAAEALKIATTSEDSLSGTQRNQIRTLAASLHELGQIQREQEKADCVKFYKEAIPFCQYIEDKPEEAVIAFNLGHAYKDLPGLRDLAQAETWYRRSLELSAEGDRQGQAQSLGQLGYIACERFKEARAADRPEEELLRHINDALKYYFQALDLLPADAVHDLAVDHNQLGNIYDDIGDLERALEHYRESIRYMEAAGNLYGAGITRRNVALALAGAGRFDEALLYAQAALRNFETYGDRAAAEIQKTQGLIAKIEEDIERG